MSSKRSRWHKCLALLVSTLGAFVAAEVVARLLFGTPLPERLPILEIQSNQNRGWMMVPSKMHYTYQHPVKINALGLRGPEVGPKSENSVRVLALGDSLTYGQGVGDGETLPAYLQNALNERDGGACGWEVINAGHRAYDTRQELALLEELGPQIRPDVVVILWFWNDLLERDIEITYKRLKPVEPIAFDFRARYEGWTRFKWNAKKLARRSTLFMVVWDIVKPEDGHAKDDERLVAGLPRLGGYLDRFLALSSEWDFELIFAIVPEPGAVDGEDETLALADQAEAAALQRGIAVVRLRTPLEGKEEVPLVPFDGHYAAEANRAMGEYLAQFMLRDK